jgi:hypothetical protein
MSNGDNLNLAGRVFTMRIIVFALIMGLVGFAGVACFLVYIEREGEPVRPIEGLPVLTLVAVGGLAAGVVASLAVPGLVFSNAQRQIVAGTWTAPPGVDPNSDLGKLLRSDSVRLLGARQSELIVGLALLEGPALLALVAFLQEARPYALVLAAVAVILMLLRFPSVRARLEQDLERLKSLRPG